MVKGDNRPTQTACGVVCRVNDQRNGACCTLQCMTVVHKYSYGMGCKCKVHCIQHVTCSMAENSTHW